MKISNKIVSSLLGLCLLPMAMMAEMNGVIQDSGNQPLVGYLLRNTANDKFAVSNKLGEFELPALKGDVIEVSIDGVMMDQFAVSNADDIQITLAQNPFVKQIEQVSYGKIDRARSAAAVDMIEADDLEGTSFLNSQHALIGKMASLHTWQTGGLPGDDQLNFLIRGKSSEIYNTALIMVDGFESSIEHLNASEIESVTVLKDAVATTLYGMRGANGVILVKTKRGTEGKTQLKVDIDYGMVSPLQRPQFAGAADYARMHNEARMNDGLTPRYVGDDLTLQGTDPYLYPNVDWRKELLKPLSNVVDATVQLTGGSKRVRYYTLLSYTTYDGAFKHTETNEKYSTQNRFNRINFRTNIAMDIAKGTEMNVRLGGRIQNETYPEVGSVSLYNSLLDVPSSRYAIYNPDGSLYGNNQFRSNPMGKITNEGYDDRHSRYMNMSLDLKHKMDYLTKGLSLNAAMSFTSMFNVREKYTADFAVYEPGLVDETAEDGTVSQVPGYIEYGKNKLLTYDERAVSQDRTQNIRASIDYDRAFDKNSVQASLIWDMSEQVYANTTEPYRYMMFALAANYGFDNRYFVDLVASYNGTNSFAPGKRYGLFPALGFSWVLSNEEFMADKKNIDLLKLRLSGGLTGLDAVTNADYGRFMYIGNYGTDGEHYFGEVGAKNTGLSEGTMANPDLTWETGYNYNIGLDMRFFKSFSASLDLFQEKRTGILQSYATQVTDMLGWGLPYYNHGIVVNRGMDLTLGYHETYKSGFTFGVDANVGYAANLILEKYELKNGTFTRIGDPLGAIYGYETDGFFADAADIAASPKSTFHTVQPGDIKYKDLSGRDGQPDGKIDEYDRVKIGCDVPTVRFGMNLEFGFKGVYLKAQFDGMAGYQKNVRTNIVYDPLDGGNGNISQFAVDNYWTSERGNDALLPRLTYSGSPHNSQTSDLYVKNASFLRLRTAELGYALPKSALKTMHMSNFKIYLRGHNLFGVDAMPGLDAELTSGYPMLRSYNVGLNIEL